MITKQIQKILVPLDESNNSFRGLKEAIVIARGCQAVITGLYVSPLSPPGSPEQKKYIENYLLKNVNKFLKKAKTLCAQNGILFYSKILLGDEGPKIVRFAQNKGFNLIVIGSRGRSSMRETFLGSTSNYVVHKSNIPVLVVR